MALAAVNDKLLIDPEPVKTYAEHQGLKYIVIPEKYKYGPIDPPIWGLILSVGSRCRKEWRRGQRVLFGKWSPARFSHDGKDYMVVNEQDILLRDMSRGD